MPRDKRAEFMRVHPPVFAHSAYSMELKIGVGPVLRRRRSSRKKRPSTKAVCVRWPKVPFHEASVLQTDLKIE
jgi:hypothetical protein